ncbi:MAG: HAMP domain-containing sensor histidine kinase [Eubacteriales bacterium]|nr:HAMP domain-containing sensor histidine kinase [Eubacteriales bacterium]
MKNKIFIKLLCIFGVVMLLFTFILGNVFLTLFKNHTIAISRESMQKKAVSIAASLSAFESTDIQSFRNYLGYIDELTMADVWLIDRSLNIYTCGKKIDDISYASLPENADQMISDVFTGNISYSEDFSDTLGSHIITVGAPVVCDGLITGAVLIHSPVSGISDAVSQGMLALTVGCIIALIASIAVSAYISYRLTVPIRKMDQAVHMLSVGDYDFRTGIDYDSTALGPLASRLDTLADRLKSADEEHRSLDKMREEFAVTVSHELRTPVSVLKGSLELLNNNIVTDAGEIAEYYSHMLKETEHIERMVNDLLELTRLQDEGFMLRMSEMNLCDAVRDALRSVRRAAHTKNITVSSSIPENECLINGDYDRIRQLIMIILNNAVKFSYDNGNVDLTLNDTDGYELCITDYGTGISPDDMPHIFERFHKSTAENNKDGTGLGLTIASEIVRRHDASITAESDNGKTVFRIVFLRNTSNTI